MRQRFKEIEEDLAIYVSEDGKVATFRLLDRLRELHDDHKSLGLVRPSCGSSKEEPHVVVFTFDGFPVEAVSVEHTAIFSASLINPTLSEEFLRIISCGTLKETTTELNRMFAMRKIDKDFNLITTRGYYTGEGDEKVHVELTISADKKAVEMLRGCSPGCAWCTCTAAHRLKQAWAWDYVPPTWQAALAKLKQVCSGAFPEIFDLYAWAHTALPFEKLTRKCPVCNKKPFDTVAQYEARQQYLARCRADTSKEGKAKFAAERSRHAGAHTHCLA